MRYPSIKEAKKYASELLPAKSGIYVNGSTLYSNFKTLSLKKEFTIPSKEWARSGILHKLSMIWYTSPKALHLYSYDTNTTETISNFSSDVQHVLCFRPVRDIFHSSIRLCLLVVTESDIMIYAIDNHSIVNTEFSSRLHSPVQCVDVSEGRIYVGCKNGNVYQAIYSTIDIINYRYMSLYTPYSFVKSICGMFRSRARGIIDISVHGDHLVALGSCIVVYRVNGGIYKEYSISHTEEYVKVQIVEGSPLFFYCVQKDGKRDFFGREKVLSKEFSAGDAFYRGGAEDGVIGGLQCPFVTDASKVISYRPGDSSRLVCVTFNEDQLRNFSRVRPVENLEILVVHTMVRTVSMADGSLVILGDGKLSVYEILDCRRFLLSCRPQEIWAMYKNYGDVEFMVRYYELLASNEDVARMEGVCKNENVKNHALFVFIYGLVRQVLDADLGRVPESRGQAPHDQGSIDVMEGIISKLRIVRNKIPMHFNEARCFIDEFIQTNFYITLLTNYGIHVQETMESILLVDSDFKSSSLKALLSAVSLNHSIEPLLKIMKNSCPMYLPIEQVNFQRGMDLLEKENGSFLAQSLECFKNTSFDAGVVRRYNALGFYYGSVVLIRDKFDFPHEEAVALLKESVRCQKAMDAGLGSTNETFLYALFEVLVGLDRFSPCRCCEGGDLAVDLLKIENPLFVVFLKDKNTRNPRTYQLYWKYLLYRGLRAEAVEAIVAMCSFDLPLQQKLNLLEMALTIAAGIDFKAADEKVSLHGKVRRMLRLSKVQIELMERDPLTKTNQLLTADSLFNDYCCNHPDLGIKVLDIVGYGDKKVLRSLYVQHFQDLGLSECLSFLKEITRKDLELVIDLLIDKMEDTRDMCERLLACGFGYGDILKHVRDAVGFSRHPKVKDALLKNVESFTVQKDLIETGRYCENPHGRLN